MTDSKHYMITVLSELCQEIHFYSEKINSECFHKLSGIRYLLCVLIASICSWSCSIAKDISNVLGMQPVCLMLWLWVHASIQSFKVWGPEDR